MRISDWSSDVCSSDLENKRFIVDSHYRANLALSMTGRSASRISSTDARPFGLMLIVMPFALVSARTCPISLPEAAVRAGFAFGEGARSEEHTSELQSLMRISYAVFCLKKKNTRE